MFFMWNYNNVTLCFNHRNEREANRIGLILMATAGYDPLMAYEAFDKMGQSYDDNVVIRFKDMEEAYNLYKEVKSSTNLRSKEDASKVEILMLVCFQKY